MSWWWVWNKKFHIRIQLVYITRNLVGPPIRENPRIELWPSPTTSHDTIVIYTNSTSHSLIWRKFVLLPNSVTESMSIEFWDPWTRFMSRHILIYRSVSIRWGRRNSVRIFRDSDAVVGIIFSYCSNIREQNLALFPGNGSANSNLSMDTLLLSKKKIISLWIRSSCFFPRRLHNSSLS